MKFRARDHGDGPPRQLADLLAFRHHPPWMTIHAGGHSGGHIDVVNLKV